MQEILANQELLWVLTVIYDLGLAILLYRFFGKYGLYAAVILGIILGNLQGGKVSELEVFGYSFTASMGAILYSGIYFATDVLNAREYDVYVIEKTNETAARVFPVVLDVNDPSFYTRLELIVENNKQLSRIDGEDGSKINKLIKKLPYFVSNGYQLLRLYLLKPLNSDEFQPAIR